MNQLQVEDLKILKVLDEFCSKYDLEYFLYAGTLLGAVRHQGFIPWDDDVDIAMTRETFNNFEKKIIKSDLLNNGFHFQSNRYSDYYSSQISKLRSNTLNIKENVSQTQHGYHGPWVDIFPLDNIPDDEKLREKQFKQVFFYNRIIAIFQLVKVKENDKGIKRKIKSFMQKFNEKFYKRYFFMNFLYKRRLHHMTKYNDQETKACAEMAYMFFNKAADFNKNIITKKEISNFKRVPFENTTAMVPTKSHSILKRKFNDYMKLPPEEERKKHQIDYLY